MSARACAEKFALYLYNNNYLEEFTIEKNYARQIYNEHFKVEQKTRLNFGSVFFYSLEMLRKQKNHDLMIYNANKLRNLIKKEANVDAQFKKFKKTSPVKKNTVVSQSVSFNSNKRSKEEIVLTNKECKLCEVQFESEQKYNEHLREQKHKFMEQFNKAVKESKKGSELQFTIDGSPTLNNIIIRKQELKTFRLQLKNNTDKDIKIVSIQSKSEVSEVQFNPSYPTVVLSSKNIEYSLTVNALSEGIIYFPVLYSAEINNTIQLYSIELVFHIHNDFFDDLHPVEPYRSTFKPVIKEYIQNVDSGERPNIFPRMPQKVPLKQYLLPLDIAVVLNAGLKTFDGMTSSQHTQLVNINNLLNVEDKSNCLKSQNYTKLLDLLLYIEEHQMYKDIRDYDQENQELIKVGGLFELEVPGLAEHRPSVIFADSVFVREHKDSQTLYEGFVYQVKQSSVLLKFSKHFTNDIFISGKKFYVHFTFNRYPLRVEHQAVEFVKKDNIAHLLFPTKIPSSVINASDLRWFNRDIANNPQQQQAVQAVLKRTAMPAPYLIFGPPGTGKTMTLVECIKQIHKLTKFNMLICTPSNNAANEITRRLLSVPTTDMFRFIAPSFPYSHVPEEIRKYTNLPNGVYYQPTIEKFLEYRIVITTLVSAAKLLNSGCPSGHFGYVLIDESGQATETETLIPIAGILSGGGKNGVITGQIVLAGDPMQLGPVIHSTLAQEYGFGVSMLERLMVASESYKKDDSHKYNPSALTKLLKNYRSHSVLIKQPNELFYENELEVAGDHLINAALNWEYLPNKSFPLFFHSVVGIDIREKNSPSFFNIQEIQMVMHYLDLLIGSKMHGISIKEEHIGIVSPYKKQVDKIKQACAKKKYNRNLMIGSVEQIQGQERLIIIISTVRSSSNFLKFDSKHHLGFLNNPKRFNVAITRAKALLIVIGNPNILQHDKNWHSLLFYCKENNAVIGEKFDFVEDQDMEKLINTVDCVSLNGETNPEGGPSFSRGNL